MANWLINRWVGGIGEIYWFHIRKLLCCTLKYGKKMFVQLQNNKICTLTLCKYGRISWNGLTKVFLFSLISWLIIRCFLVSLSILMALNCFWLYFTDFCNVSYCRHLCVFSFIVFYFVKKNIKHTFTLPKMFLFLFCFFTNKWSELIELDVEFYKV